MHAATSHEEQCCWLKIDEWLHARMQHISEKHERSASSFSVAALIEGLNHE
jgi:hypothetical protein